MAWGDIRVSRVLAACLMLLPAIAQAEVLVVRAIGPSASAYPPGRTLADTAKLSLRAGDQITLLDDRGTRALRGPGNFTAAGGAAVQGGTTLAALVGQSSVRRARIGAVRNVTADDTATSPARRPNIFVVDVNQSGATCLADATQVTLWRSDANAVGTTSVSGGGATATLNWGRGQSTQAWPSALPVGDGASYQFAGPTTRATVRLKLLKAQPGGLRDLAAMLIAAGCKAQLDTLITTAGGAG